MAVNPAESMNSNTERSGWRLEAILSSLLFLFTMLFVTAPTGFNYDLTGPSEVLLTGSWINRLQWIPIYLAAALLVWRYRGPSIRFMAEGVNPFLIALLVFALLSIFWSPVPGVTLRRGISLAGLLVVAVSFHMACWYPQRLMRLLYGSLGLLLLASAIAAVFFPALGVDQEGEFIGFWLGITTQKNSLGSLAALGVLVGTHALLTRGEKRWSAALYVGLAGLVIIMSGSKTSQITAFIGVIFMAALVRPPVNNRYWLPVTLVLGALAVAIPLHFYTIAYGFPTFAEVFSPLFELVGRNATLTGRDDIWQWMLPVVNQHWLLGTGYGAFWLGDYGLSGQIAKNLDFYPWQSHNGFLDIINELGVVGLGLLLAFLIFHVQQLRRLRYIDPAAYALYLPMLIIILLHNLTESSVFNGVNLYTVALLFSSVAVSRTLWHHKCNSTAYRCSESVRS